VRIPHENIEMKAWTSSTGVASSYPDGFAFFRKWASWTTVEPQPTSVLFEGSESRNANMQIHFSR